MAKPGERVDVTSIVARTALAGAPCLCERQEPVEVLRIHSDGRRTVGTVKCRFCETVWRRIDVKE